MVIKTGADPGKNCSIVIDGKPITFFITALDLQLRPDGVKVVTDEIDLTSGQKVYSTRTFYATGDCVIDIEMEEVDEKSATSKE